MRIIARIFPFLEWFKGYSAATLRIDFIAGLTVALVLVPQSMAYAQLAGLPAYYGLYAAFLPPIVANLFGSSRQLATGPVAVVSLMTNAALAPIAVAGSEAYIAYALMLAFMVGAFQFLLGMLRLGLVVNFLSHPVVNGFTNAAAIIIATSQLSKIFGVSVDSAPHHYETVYRVVVAALHYTHLPTLGMALLAFAVMIVVRRIDRRIPNVLLAVVITTALSWGFGFEKDDRVSLSQIGSERVVGMIQAFNQTATAKKELEELRTTGTRLREKLAAEHGATCTRCHQARPSALLETGSTGPAAPPQLEARALVLHQMGGLLDLHIDEIKKLGSEQRGRLRQLSFVRTHNGEGSYTLYPSGEVPQGVRPEAGTWRLKVGESKLDTEGMRIIGGGAVVATIPEGLPAIRVPRFDFSIVPKLLAAAIIISILGFMEAISIAKAMAARTRQKLDANQELIGQGLANMIGCFGQSYAVSGSFSRSAVNLQAGAVTGMANVFSGLFVMLVLLFFSGWLYHLPQAVLAAIIMMAVAGLLNVSGFVHAWRTNRFDGAVSCITLAGTLLFAPHLEWGIFIGVALSLGAYLFRSMRPHVAELAPHPDGALRDARRYELKTCRHISVISFEGPLNFASSNYLEGEVLDRVAELPDLRHVLIAGNGISEIDASGEESLRHIVERLRTAGYKVSFSGIPDAVRDVLKRSHLFDVIGEENFYPTRFKAVAAIYASAHAGSQEPDCPYAQAMPRVSELSLHPDGSLRDAERNQLPLCRHIAAFRFDDPLTFANAAWLEQQILERVADRPALRHVLFVAHGISDIDATGAEKLGELVRRLNAEGYTASFSGLKEEVVDELRAAGVDRVIGYENIYPTQVMAIAAIHARAHIGSSEANCPLKILAPHLTEVSLHPDGSLRDARRHQLQLCDSVAFLRFDGPLPFASPRAFQSDFIRWMKGRRSVRHVIFLAQSIDGIKEREIGHLLALAAAVRDAGYRVMFANFTDQTFDQLARSGAADELGLDNIFPSDALALAAVFTDVHDLASQTQCPLRGMLPAVIELSLHPDGSLRDALRHGLQLCRHIAAIRFDGPLNFATVGYFEEQLMARLRGRRSVKHVLIAAHTLRQVDSVAAEELMRMVRMARKNGYSLAISGLNDEVMEMARKTGGYEEIGPSAIYPTQAKALEAIHAEAHRGSDENPCPLQQVVYRATV